MNTFKLMLVTFALSMSASSVVTAGTIWDGNGANTNINTANNWDDNVVPSFTGSETLTFGTGGSLASLNELVSVAGLVLNRSENFEIGGAETLTIGSSGITANQTGTRTYTLTAPTSINVNQTWNVDGNNQLVMNGPLGGSGSITKTGTGNLRLAQAPTGLGSFTINAGRLTGGSSGGYALTSAVDVSSGATLTQADLTLFELTGSYSDVAGAVVASPNQSSSAYAIGSRGILFSQGGSVTLNGTIKPSAPNSNRFGVIGVNDQPLSNNATAMTIKGIVQADIPTANLNFTIQQGSSIYVDKDAVIDNLHLVAKSRRSVNFYGDGSNGAKLELDPGFKAVPTTLTYNPAEIVNFKDDGTDTDFSLPPHNLTEESANAADIEFGFPRIAGITFITHANQSLPAAGISFNSIQGNITGVNTTATTWRTATNAQTYGNQVQVATGTLTIEPNTDLTLTNTNSLTIASGSVVVQRSAESGNLTVNGGVLTSGTAAITIAAGNTLVLNGTLTDFAPSSSALDVLGTLSGTGTVGTDVAIATGTLSPGQSPGTMTFTEDLSLNADSTLAMELAGTSAGDFDQIATTGNGTLTLVGGTLSVSLIDDFTPQSGDQFNLFSLVSAPTGTFGTVSLPGLPEGLSWDTTNLYTTTGTIAVVPEPPLALAAAATAVAFLVFRGHRRKGATSTRFFSRFSDAWPAAAATVALWAILSP